jgi:hypothetical protein
MDANFKHDDYIQNNNVKSILCAPIMKGKSLSGVLYLEIHHGRHFHRKFVKIHPETYSLKLPFPLYEDVFKSIAKEGNPQFILVWELLMVM